MPRIVTVHQPAPTPTTLPFHEHNARRHRDRTERPIGSKPTRHRPDPTPAAPLGRPAQRSSSSRWKGTLI